MYKKEFEDSLKSGKIYKALLLYGREPFFIKEYSQKAADLTNIPKEQRVILYYDEFDFDRAKNYLSQPSLFGDGNLLILKNDKAIPTKELSKLIEICLKTAGSHLIFELYSDDAKKILKQFSKNEDTAYVRFFKPKPYEAFAILKQKAQNARIECDDQTLQYLLEFTGYEIESAIKELEKLSLRPKITKSDIEELVYPLSTVDLETLFLDILTKKEAADSIYRLENEEINEMRVILGLENFLQQLFMINAFVKLKGRFDSKELFGYRLPIDVEKRRLSLAIKIKTEKFGDILDLLQKCELKLKSQTHIDRRSLMISTLMKIQALL